MKTNDLATQLARELSDLRQNIADLNDFCRKVMIKAAEAEAENEELRLELKEIRMSYRDDLDDRQA